MGWFRLASLGFWRWGLRAKLTPLRGSSDRVITGHRLGGISTQGVSTDTGLQGVELALHDMAPNGLYNITLN